MIRVCSAVPAASVDNAEKAHRDLDPWFGLRNKKVE